MYICLQSENIFLENKKKTRIMDFNIQKGTVDYIHPGKENETSLQL